MLRTALTLLAALGFALALPACGDKHDDDQGHEHGHDHDGSHEHGHDGDHDDHDHAEHGPHTGEVAAFAGGDEKGFVELKLHDDKGDLELWLTKDQAGKEPFDLPLASTITVTFTDKDNKAVTLAVRNTDQNEDEDGHANNRGGQTNYFIFPGASGADATWLMGATFSSQVKVTFQKGDTTFTSDTFTLVPHTHHEGHEHGDG